MHRESTGVDDGFCRLYKGLKLFDDDRLCSQLDISLTGVPEVVVTLPC